MSERENTLPRLAAAALLALTTIIESGCGIPTQASSFEANAQPTPTPLLRTPVPSPPPEITPMEIISGVGPEGTSNPTLQYRRRIEGINYGASPSPSPSPSTRH